MDTSDFTMEKILARRQSYTYSREGLLDRVQRYTHTDGTTYPTGVQIELTSYCNATCFFCAHTGSVRPQKHLDVSLYKKMIDEIWTWPHRLLILYLTGLGEPLMHPKWREMYAYTKGLPGAFTTNCSLLNNDDIEFILMLDFHEVALSLDTLNPERHQKIRGFSVDRVAPKIEKAFALAKRINPSRRLIVSTTVTYDTLEDMKEIYDWLTPQMEGLDNSLWHIKQIGHFPDINAPLQIMPPMGFIKGLNKILPPHPKVIVIQDDDALRPYCTLWFDRVTILSDGNAVPCCHQAKARQDLGNVADTTLLEIYNSQVWRSTQQQFALKEDPGGWNEIPYCKDCR
jgi:MoaA/NifB/PqqE/SkfB family radical SAM enzyme